MHAAPLYVASLTPQRNITWIAAVLSGMWDRTLTVGSAGKSFSVTGWKVHRRGIKQA